MELDLAKLQEIFKKGKKLIITLICIAFLLVAGSIGLSLYKESIELNEIGGFQSILYKDIFYKVITAASFGLITFLAVLITNIFIKKNISRSLKANQIIDLNNQQVKKLPNALLALLSGLIVTFFTFYSNLYLNIMMYFNGTSFDVNTPIINKDAGYFVFELPFLKNLVTCLIILIVFLAIYTLVYYLLASLHFLEDTSLYKQKGAILHFVVYGIILLLTILLSVRISYESLVYSDFYDVTGIGFVSANIYKFYYMVLPYLIILAIALTLFFIIKKNIKGTIISVVGIIPVAYILTGIVAVVFQQFVVKPNEPLYEKPYLKNNMEMTRHAFNIDKIKTENFSISEDFSKDVIERNKETYDNIRILDYNSALLSNIQLQSNRMFYTFTDGDVSNYNINGKDTPVYISAREISQENMPGSTSYANRVFKYTHGYGVVVNPLNKLTKQGQVEFYLDGIKMDNNGIESLNVTEPRIYYGENTKNYVVVNPKESNKEPEIDYDGESQTSYEGTGGIKLSFFNRLMYSITEGDTNLLISSNIDSNSKILLNREIITRARKALPFLTIDDDPYMVIDKNGKLKWIIDAYTSTTNFPYANTYNGVNYIRNSVKIVVDAYNGNLKAYAVDREDPILKTYMKIYPGIISAEELPEEMASHMKYPEKIFKLQTEVMKRYHLDPNDEINIDSFYQKQDFWDIAKTLKGSTDKNSEVKDIDCFYNMIKLPNADSKEELILMRPFTPSATRHNMVAWLAVRNNAENYGEMILYKFPKNTNILGPNQIEVNINQISEISEKMTLWGQSGSKISMGNLLVIPIEDKLLYVLPFYLQSAGESSIPQMKTVVVGYQKENDFLYGIGNNIDSAFTDLFDNSISNDTSPDKTDTDIESPDVTPDTNISKDELNIKIKELKKLIKELEELLN